ncbi:putative endoplasmic reticulum metallopeptidase 1 [Rhodotorula toruloides]|nr:putative endoplasmic reticulum metallopeptidase 1 [Rhodotorula toruloides]
MAKDDIDADGTGVVAVKPVKTAPSTPPRASPSKQWSLLPSLAVILPLLALFTYISVHLHYALPEPQHALFSPDGSPVFSESKAMRYIHDLAAYGDGTPRYRIVGTKEMVETDNYLLDKIAEIREEVVQRHPNGGMQVEVWHQLFDFMDKKVWKKYFGISNVIVRLSDGTPASKANAVLVNAHSDSTLPSPGAADDLVGVAVMLEALRVMALGDRKLTNAAIFLFNGAEESLQDASHLFITQHPLRTSVRAVINLEACGTDGKEIVFQATSPEMIQALARTPSPYATIIASEIFQTGLILSDGNLTGLDMALVQNSYRYHTMLDTADAIEPGSVQHMGDNVLALLEYLTSPETTMGNSAQPTPVLPRAPTSHTIFFSALGGKVFVVYSRATATILYGILAALVAVVVTDRVDWAKEKKVYILSVVGVLGGLISSIVGANLVAAALSLGMGKSMTWFRNENYPLLVFGPPSLLAVVLYQYFFVSNRIRQPVATVAQDAADSALIEHASLVSQVVYNTAVTLIGHALGVGSSYLIALGAASSLLALVINDYVLRRHSTGLHLATYVIGQSLPLLIGVEGIIGFLDLFVPLTGRLGADAPVDFIIATLFLPFCHRWGASFTARLAVFFTFATAFSLGWFSRPSWSAYDAQHPKRLLILHMENTTTSPPEFHLHVASVDGNPFFQLVSKATEGLTAPNSVPEATIADDLSVDWDIIYPVSQFLTTYKVPLPPVESTYTSPYLDTFKVSVTRNSLNAIKQTRSIDVVLDHPAIIWPVLSFDGDVIAWDLPEPPQRGVIRHHVKSVASYGVNRFTLSLTLQLTPEQFAAAIREDQRAKGQRADASAEDKSLASLRIDYSGLDIHGMYPASVQSDDVHEDAQRQVARQTRLGMRFFEEFSKRLEKEPVDAMLLSAIAGVASSTPSLPACTCRRAPSPSFAASSVARSFSSTSTAQSHDNPLGLPRNDAPPTMPRMQRGLPQKRKLPGVKKVVVVSSGKGGVGKSSVAVNLALALSSLPPDVTGGGRPRVGVLDLDIFGPSIPKLMGLEGAGEPFLTAENRLTPLRAHGLPCMSMGFLLPNNPPDPSDPTKTPADTPVVWRGMMVMKAVQQLLFDVDWRAGTGGSDLDVLVVDTPPGTGDVTLSLGQLVTVDGSVIVSTPQNVAIIDTRKGVAMFRKLGIPITGAVLNMSHFLCPGSSTPHYVFGRPDSFMSTCSALSLDVLAQIPIEPAVSARGDEGSPVVMLPGAEGSGGSKAREAFLALGAEVWRRINQQQGADATAPS